MTLRNAPRRRPTGPTSNGCKKGFSVDWVERANFRCSTDHPTAALWPVYTNNTCLPTDNPAGTCTQGFYSDYVIVATTEKHIKTGVDFARKHNLRLLM